MNTDIIRTITVASAAALVVASAGFGAYYAWTTGNHHGPRTRNAFRPHGARP